jgi:hypothetical protein
MNIAVGSMHGLTAADSLICRNFYELKCLRSNSDNYAAACKFVLAIAAWFNGILVLMNNRVQVMKGIGLNYHPYNQCVLDRDNRKLL